MLDTGQYPVAIICKHRQQRNRVTGKRQNGGRNNGADLIPEDRKFNRTIKVCMAAALRSMPIFIVELRQKIQISSHPHAKRQELFRHTLKVSPAPNRTPKRTHGEKKLLVAKRCADQTRTLVQAAPTYPIDGNCPPSRKPLRPPTAAGHAPGQLWVAAWIRRCGREFSARCWHRR